MQLKKRLLMEQEELWGLLVRNRQHWREANGEGTRDIAEKAASSNTKEFLFRRANDQWCLLQLIEEALQRFAEGTYGHCVICGGEIQRKRLKAVPWARLCIGCQEKQERGLL